MASKLGGAVIFVLIALSLSLAWFFTLHLH